jgi:hypothetical protein
VTLVDAGTPGAGEDLDRAGYAEGDLDRVLFETTGENTDRIVLSTTTTRRPRQIRRACPNR